MQIHRHIIPFHRHIIPSFRHIIPCDFSKSAWIKAFRATKCLLPYFYLITTRRALWITVKNHRHIIPSHRHIIPWPRHIVPGPSGRLTPIKTNSRPTPSGSPVTDPGHANAGAVMPHQLPSPPMPPAIRLAA